MSNRRKNSALLGQVRIIAGQWRGRRLNFPSVAGLRPSGDRVRETLFNWLQNDLPQAHCLDLFAGSGALGFEAASRYAAKVVMIEKNREAYAALQQNSKTLASTTIEIIHDDATSWLKSNAASQQFFNPNRSAAFDIIFLDPPFASTLLDEALQALDAGNWLAPQALVYVEHAADQAPVNLPGKHWQLHRQRNFGGVDARLYKRL